MRVISLNVNGLKNAVTQGLFDWLAAQNADVICLQNTYITNLEFAQNYYNLPNYLAYASCATNPTNGGCIIYCKLAPKAIITNLDLNIATENGIFIQADFAKISIASITLPYGKYDFELNLKFKLMDELLTYFNKQAGKRRDYIYCASLYVAHKKIDVYNSAEGEKAPGFLPAERIWLDEIIRGSGYIDALREITREGEKFSYWQNNEQARKLNLGMRFDYQLVTSGLRLMIDDVNYVKDAEFSLHAPVVVDYAWNLSV